ncbi:ribosomal protein LP2 [Megalopta genalis]|uniref:ribosomal protein LP2 n=1 Tax=Megalopta genalis TaxID=115081 RepID=UPI003FD5360E
MRYVAAYLLAALGGKASPNQNDIEKILSSVGIEFDPEKLKLVISELNGKSIDELIAQGREKLSSMPVGGSAVASTAAPAAGAAAAPVEEKKEEKKPAKEESESDDDDMGFGLFD